MPELMVSVRSVEEMRVALAGGADLIDVKEPNLGSLGAASSSVWESVAMELQGQSTLLSIALGELTDLRDQSGTHLIPARVNFAKVALAGCQTMEDWQTQLQDIFLKLPKSTAPVAVHYADHQRASSPAFEQVLQFATQQNCEALLIDTFDKQSGSLFEVVTVAQVQHWVQLIKSAGLKCVLAGSLAKACLNDALSLQPDVIAVRGAVCQGDRTRGIDRTLVQQFASLIHRQEPSVF
ncbi:MAG: (5-formylfuran-3-yl)methyl phosphate synthase [Pirellulales bacterium]